MTGGETRRVLFVANDPPGRAVYRYRCENIADVLRAAGWQADVAFVGDRRVRVDHDVIVLHRICAGPEGDAYARAARAVGATLVYGADDLVWDADAFPPDPIWRRLWMYAPRHATMLERADAVLVSTEFLACAARQRFPGKPTWTVRNFLPEAQLCLAAVARDAAPPRAPERVTFGYLSGTATHDADLGTIAHPLANTLRNFPHADLLIVGPVQTPPVLQEADLAPRIHRHAFVPYDALPALIAQNIDVNLAPLDLAFTLAQGKSEIKLLEAGALGIPTIVAASAGFREALAAHRDAGWIAEDEAAWRRALAVFAGDPEARRTARAATMAYVHECGTAEAHRTHIADVFAAIRALPRPLPTRRCAVVGHPLAPRHLAKTVIQAARGKRIGKRP